MNFGFDIDRTITAAPEQFGAIMSALTNAGHYCYVITGTMDPIATPGHYDGRVMQLLDHGIREVQHYQSIHIVVAPHAENKAKYCVENDICFMFDDAPAYIAAMRNAGIMVAAMPH